MTLHSDPVRAWAVLWDEKEAALTALAAVAALHKPSEHVTIGYAHSWEQLGNPDEWEQVAVEHPDGTTTSLEPPRIRCDQCHCDWPCATAAALTAHGIEVAAKPDAGAR